MKTITKTLKNAEIYETAVNLNSNFRDNDTYFPALIAFAIQKNRNVFSILAQEIENGRLQVARRYGTQSDTLGAFAIAKENIENANNELNELLNATQEVQIYTISIEGLKDLQLNSQEMSSILFMIEE